MSQRIVTELCSINCLAGVGIAMYAFDNAHPVVGWIVVVVTILNGFDALISASKP